ncbi:MAG: hypothetical protein M1815_000042 [Lichina confinis]|nr:MAG: hypothetical protein M1815_000042 [Lichina confinis]
MGPVHLGSSSDPRHDTVVVGPSLDIDNDDDDDDAAHAAAAIDTASVASLLTDRTDNPSPSVSPRRPALRGPQRAASAD